MMSQISEYWGGAYKKQFLSLTSSLLPPPRPPLALSAAMSDLSAILAADFAFLSRADAAGRPSVDELAASVSALSGSFASAAPTAAAAAAPPRAAAAPAAAADVADETLAEEVERLSATVAALSETNDRVMAQNIALLADLEAAHRAVRELRSDKDALAVQLKRLLQLQQ